MNSNNVIISLLLLDIIMAASLSLYCGTGNIGVQNNDYTKASFNFSSGIEFDAKGMLSYSYLGRSVMYMADTRSDVIRTIFGGNKLKVSTFAGAARTKGSKVSLHYLIIQLEWLRISHQTFILQIDTITSFER